MTLQLSRLAVRELVNDENCSILSGEESHPLGGGSERLLLVGRRLGSLIYGRKPEESMENKERRTSGRVKIKAIRLLIYSKRKEQGKELKEEWEREIG